MITENSQHDSGFWKKHDPDTGELNAIKFIRLSLDAARVQRARQKSLAEVTPQ